MRVAACDTLEPMSYVGEGGKLIGFDLEVILMIARELDVHVEFTGMEFSAILSSVQAGKADIGAGSIIITDERKESVDFVEYYIAVQDLTKMGDIVRSRTYEAFFPLIAITIIYFVLEGLLGFAVSRIGVNFNPKRRSRASILKGVRTDD